MTRSDMYIPPEVADEVSDFPYMDKEIQGAFIFGDRERYEGQDNIEDTFVASYVITGVGDETGVTGTSEQIASLERLRQTTEFDYRMFHSHPLQTYRETGIKPDRFSPQDMSSTEARQERVNNGNYYDILVAPSPKKGKKAVFKPSDRDIGVRVDNWSEDDGTHWKEVEQEIDHLWDRIGGKTMSV
ncbi:MAG: hypothetical protein H8Z69_06070 [Nanohaloarchaea archaeon]|nr:hypothetical protein [Candidatus Nanohaloarchaea archaeon]